MKTINNYCDIQYMNKNIYTNIKTKVKEKNKGFAQGVQWLKNYNISIKEGDITWNIVN